MKKMRLLLVLALLVGPCAAYAQPTPPSPEAQQARELKGQIQKLVSKTHANQDKMAALRTEMENDREKMKALRFQAKELREKMKAARAAVKTPAAPSPEPSSEE